MSDLTEFGIGMPSVRKTAPRPRARASSAKPRGNPEREAQKAVVKWLRAVLPVGSIVASIVNEQRGLSDDPMARMRFGQARKASGVVTGMPDLVCVIPGGRTVWIEMKSAIGRTSEAQDGLHARFRSMQHHCGVARSIDDARAILAAAGIQTREVSQ